MNGPKAYLHPPLTCECSFPIERVVDPWEKKTACYLICKNQACQFYGIKYAEPEFQLRPYRWEVAEYRRQTRAPQQRTWKVRLWCWWNDVCPIHFENLQRAGWC